MIKLGGHVLRSPGRSTLSLWSWSRCQMKNTLEIFIISKDRVLSLINCPFTSRIILQTLRMWFSGSNFGRTLPYKHSRYLLMCFLMCVFCTHFVVTSIECRQTSFLDESLKFRLSWSVLSCPCVEIMIGAESFSYL